MRKINKEDIVFSPFTKQLGYLFCFLLIVGVVHLVVVSIIAFFHFILEHRLGVIEDWIFDKGWEVILISKSISLFIVLKFINLYNQDREPIKNYLWKCSREVSYQLLVVIVFQILMVVLIGRPQISDHTNLGLFKILISFLGNISFFMIDVVLFLMLDKNFRLSRNESFWRVLIFPVMLTLAPIFIFPYATGSWEILGLGSYMALYLAFWRNDNWVNPLVYLGLVVGPLAAFMGKDFVWAGENAIFRLEGELGPSIIIVIYVLTIIYLQYKVTQELDHQFGEQI